MTVWRYCLCLIAVIILAATRPVAAEVIYPPKPEMPQDQAVSLVCDMLTRFGAIARVHRHRIDDRENLRSIQQQMHARSPVMGENVEEATLFWSLLDGTANKAYEGARLEDHEAIKEDVALFTEGVNQACKAVLGTQTPE